jgi:hypothetical protein
LALTGGSIRGFIWCQPSHLGIAAIPKLHGFLAAEAGRSATAMTSYDDLNRIFTPHAESCRASVERDLLFQAPNYECLGPRQATNWEIDQNFLF